MKDETVEYKGDSYLVDIIPPARTAPYPMIYICPRKKNRPKGRLGLDSEREIFLKVSAESFDSPNIEETARQMGKVILEDSGIIKEYRNLRRQ